MMKIPQRFQALPGAQKWISQVREHAVSSLSQDRLEMVWVSEKKGCFEVSGRESFPLTAFAVDEALKAFRQKISNRLRGKWIHTVLRQSGFVKTFPLSGKPGLSETRESLLMRRVREEMPHLADEIIYHAEVQAEENGNPSEGLLFGISKAALEDSFLKFSKLGVIPDAAVLSTEVMRWYYQQKMGPNKSSGNLVLVHDTPEQTEMLCLESGAVSQSRWFKKDFTEPVQTETMIQSARLALLQQSGTGFERTVVFGNPPIVGNAVISAHPEESGATALEAAAGLPDLAIAAVHAVQSGGVFDFTPVHWEKRRSDKRTDLLRDLCLTSLLMFFASALIVSLVNIVSMSVETAWIGARRSSISEPVKSLKKLQEKAAAAEVFYEKKTAPVFLLQSLRASIPSGLLLKTLDFDSARQNQFHLQGSAVSEPLITEFVEGLQQQGVFTGLRLERVESSQDESGGRVFEFALKGNLQERGKV